MVEHVEQNAFLYFIATAPREYKYADALCGHGRHTCIMCIYNIQPPEEVHIVIKRENAAISSACSKLVRLYIIQNVRNAYWIQKIPAVHTGRGYVQWTAMWCGGSCVMRTPTAWLVGSSFSWLNFESGRFYRARWIFLFWILILICALQPVHVIFDLSFIGVDSTQPSSPLKSSCQSLILAHIPIHFPNSEMTNLQIGSLNI